MNDRAAPPSLGRRPGFATVVLLVGFMLLSPAIFLLAPLALLFLFARPRSLREALWTGLAIAGVVKIVSDMGTQSLPAQAVTVGGLVLSVAFLAAALLLPRATTLLRASLATAIGLIGVVVWAQATGMTLASFDQAVLRDLEQTMQRSAAPAEAVDSTAVTPTAPAPGDSIPTIVSPETAQMLAVAPTVASWFPAFLALQAMLGLALAWRWHHRIAVVPLGSPPRTFAEFRFSDHLIWGAILNLGVVLLVQEPTIARIAACGLVVWTVIYMARGVAVLSVLSGVWSAPMKVLFAVLLILAFPIAFGMFLSIGLGDTWIDFRSRLARTSGGGHADGSNSP